MTTRQQAPNGAPCWADLMTNDLAGSRSFYPALFGWEAQEANEEFGGYFMFTRQGVPVAGCMGAQGDGSEDGRWRPYLSVPDAAAAVEAALAHGGELRNPLAPVADMGVQAVLADPAGGGIGIWQPGTFPGFTVLEEASAPSWFELHTRDHATVVAFYESVFGLQAVPVADSDEFRYSTLHPGGSDQEVAGIMDATAFLPEGEAPSWSIYWEVDDVAASVALATSLGAKVVHPPEDTPYGTLAALTDPAGAGFKLRTSPA